MFLTYVFMFVIIFGIFNAKKEKLPSNKLFLFCLASFLLSYILLIILSIAIRPMVTCRYLKIFSLVWYMAGALVLVSNKNIQKPFIVVAFIGFFFTYSDVRFVSFDEGYKSAINTIYKNIPSSSTLLTFDNSNLFCEYYLPDYKCILQVGEKGEVLRKQNVIRNIDLYKQDFDNTVFSLSIYFTPDAECVQFDSFYRMRQNVNVCKFEKTEAEKIIHRSLNFLENN